MGPKALAGNEELCNKVKARLSADSHEQDEVLEWLLMDARELALSPWSCRVIQMLLEVLPGQGIDSLVEVLNPFALELLESPHGNHVLTKMIEKLPSTSLKPIIAQIEGKGYTSVARHRFGCRVLERLIEHGTEAEMCSLNNKFVARAEEICRHQYGNFVIQHLLEHGVFHRRVAIVQRLLPQVSQLAMHRTASHVVQKAMTYSDPEWQHAIVTALLSAEAPHSFAEVAASRYGSYVAEELLTLRFAGCAHLIEQARTHLLAAGPEQLQSAPFARVADKFGVDLPGLVHLPSSAAGDVGSDKDSEDPCV